MTDLRLFNSLTRQLEPFQPVHPGVPGDPAQPPEARVYSCGPTVYNYQHIGNMRAYVFADTLGRVLRFKGYNLKHIINITDVGHLTSDSDAGDDKMEKAAALSGNSDESAELLDARKGLLYGMSGLFLQDFPDLKNTRLVWLKAI